MSISQDALLQFQSLQMDNNQLKGSLATKFVDVEPVGDFDLLRRLIGPQVEVYIECDGIQQLFATRV
jgi:hypothetical protein